MKTNTAKKVIVSAMAIAMGAGIAGSISGTVAWYQYSTRATVAYQGAAAQCSENLQIRIVSDDATIGAWKSDLTTTDVQAYLISAGRTAANYQQLRPVTSGSLEANKAASTFYKHPLYQYATQASWGQASKTVDYIEIPLEFRVVKVDGEVDGNNGPKNFLAQDLFITDVTLESTIDGKDVTEAVRVSFAEQVQENPKEITLSKTAHTGDDAVKVYGKLDLNGDGKIDQEAGYDFTQNLADVTYGDANKTAVSAAFTSIYPTDTNGKLTGGTSIGKTKTDGALAITMRIYLEGWAELSNKTAKSGTEDVAIKSIWDAASTVGANFNLGVRFAVDAL